MNSKSRLIAVLLALTLILAFTLTACQSASDTGDTGSGDTGGSSDPVGDAADDPSITTLNLYSFTNEVPNMALRYAELFPDFKLAINNTIVATDGGGYQTTLDTALAGGGADAPDIYCAEAAFVKKYIQGDMKSYAATYKELGIDVDALISSAGIAQYSVDIGTADNEVVALGYQATGGAMIYRRSLAIDTWGTDDPEEIKAKVGPGWDQFWVAAEELKAKGYAIVSGDGDIWHSVENGSDYGWLNDAGQLVIDPKREQFFDMSKRLKDNGYHNDTVDWEEPWTADMRGEGPKQVFAFFGPAWLINYVMPTDAPTFGDWAVTEPPVGFFWGGTWVLGNKGSKIKQSAGELIEWITLDSSATGLQSYWAAGNLYDGAQHADLQGLYDASSIKKDSVASAVVMETADGSLDMMASQNIFPTFIAANAQASGKNLTQYDETINSLWRDQVREYTAGNKDKETAIADFKQRVLDELGISAA
ncbi:MAG: extracellular solute-binding protein [Oscillospiraceae bacterium]|jgi:hypothetical protein|nr:extracellular solute-binding protein [Oscillospiraceae bacterium]